jgi:F420-0:gamma-glutamyl ligase
VRKLVAARLRAATTNIADLLDAYATLHAGQGTDEATVAVSAGVYYAEDLEVEDR